MRALNATTARYVDVPAGTNFAANTPQVGDAWGTEAASGVIDRVTTVERDLASEEAPMHCDVCKKTITALLYLDD